MFTCCVGVPLRRRRKERTYSKCSIQMTGWERGSNFTKCLAPAGGPGDSNTKVGDCFQVIFSARDGDSSQCDSLSLVAKTAPGDYACMDGNTVVAYSPPDGLACSASCDASSSQPDCHGHTLHSEGRGRPTRGQSLLR